MTPEKSEHTPNNDADSDPADEQKPEEGAGDDENGGESAPAPEKSEGDSAPAGESGAEPETQPSTTATPTAQPMSEADTSEKTGEPSPQASDIQITLDRNVINLKAFKCPMDSCAEYGWHHLENGESANQSILICSLSEAIPEGYGLYFTYHDEDSSGVMPIDTMPSEDNQTLEIFLANYFKEPGSYSVTIVVAKTNEEGWIEGEPLASQPLTVNIEETAYAGTITPRTDAVYMENSEYYEGLEGLFNLNEHARTAYYMHHNNFASNVSSSNPSVFSVEKRAETDEYGVTFTDWDYVVHSAGTAMVTATIGGTTYTCNITVKKWADLDYSNLKFNRDEFTLVSGHSLGGSIAHYKWVTGSENVKDSFYVASSDDSVVTYLPSYPVDTIEDLVSNHDWAGAITLTARKPGTAKLNLYFYNPTTKESILTDSMTVNVAAPQVIGSSTPGSAFQGDIVSSGDVDSVVKQEGLSLATSLKSAESLSSDQRARLTEVIDTAKGEKAVLIDISLLRSDGTAFDRYDELAEQYEGIFTVRLKLDGDLATLDPNTIRTYRIGEDGEMEPIACWVHDGYLYITTWHFSPYAIVGQVKSATGGNTGGVDKGSQGGNTGANDTQGGGTTTVADKGNASGTSTAKNDATRASGTSRSGAPLAQTGDSLLPLAVALGVATILGALGLAVARRRMNRW